MRAALTKRVLDSLEKLAKSDAEKYEQFWVEFGQVAERGCCGGLYQQDKIAGCFGSRLRRVNRMPRSSLAGYLERMKADQERFIMWQQTVTRWRNTPSSGNF